MAATVVLIGGLYATAAILLLLIIYAWRRRYEPAVLSFIALLGALLIWTVSYAASIQVSDPTYWTILVNLTWLGRMTTSLAWLVFAMAYSGRTRYLTPLVLLALASVPIGGQLLLWLDSPLLLEYSQQELGGFYLVGEVSYGPYGLLGFAYAYVLVLVGIGLILDAVRSSTYLYTDQAISLVVGAFVPWIVNLASALALPAFDATPLAFAVTGLAFGNALFRYRLIESLPVTLWRGRDAAFETMEDGLLVLDETECVIDCNPTAAAAFGRTVESTVGHKASELADGQLSDFEQDGLEVESADGRRLYVVDARPITDQHDAHRGWVLVLRDVTRYKEYEQRLSVINRVLRHNLRNDLSVIDGYVEVMREGTSDPTVTEQTEIVLDVSRKLQQTSSKAQLVEATLDMHAKRQHLALDYLVDRALDRTIESVVDEAVESVTEGAVEGVTEGAVDRADGGHAGGISSDYRTPTVTTDIPEGIDVFAVPELSMALVELLENAIVHGEAGDSESRVHVSARVENGRVLLLIEDSGPGIQPEEVAVLNAEVETALDHGSGLGLWVSHWIVQESGGSLSFDTKGDGTTVRIELLRPVDDGTESSHEDHLA